MENYLYFSFFVVKFKYQGIVNRGRGPKFKFVMVTSTSKNELFSSVPYAEIKCYFLKSFGVKLISVAGISLMPNFKGISFP